ncbi:MAG: pyrroline-5-carboxylate reductase [Alphaproteobacteria bacterium]|nr:pyrroline-5-carboxylate reductase [Alphaproteobacteria bacterium]
MVEAPAVTLIGAGQMGGALVRGWLAAVRCGGGLTLTVHDPAVDAGILTDMEKAGVVVNPPDAGPADVLVLAVKPQTFAAAAASARAACGPQTLVISVMAGVTLAALSRALDTDRVIRAMPNTPGQIGQGVTAYVSSAACKPADLALAEQLLAPLGAVEPIPTERLMDVVTAVSGSGPAYVFLLAEVLAAAAEKEGLDPDIAARLARRTVAGAGALMLQSSEPASQLRKAVTSPGGTTQAALDILMSADGLAMLMRKAVAAATQRSRELGRGVD